jgi:CheY-like chemotaxis protein
MQVTAVASAHEALAVLERPVNAPFDLAVVDGCMPGTDGLDLLERIGRSPTLRAALPCPALVLLSSPDRQAETARCRALGVPRFLVKPAGADELLGALRGLLQPVVGDVAEPQAQPPRRSLRILLAEDNVVNQRLAGRLLEKQGHTVTVVATGGEAVAAQRSSAHDLMLMDLQMPDLDGLEATALIRGCEQPGRHVPIVAVTAHAMKGDRERCLAAGMDGYLTKPLRQGELFALLDAFFPADGAAPTAQPRMEEDTFDEMAFRLALGGDDDLCRDLVETFQAQAPVLCMQIRAAIAAREGTDLQRAAHTLKGSLRVFAARAAPTVEQIEERGRDGDWHGIDELAAQMEDEVTRLQTALAEVLDRLRQECAA